MYRCTYPTASRREPACANKGNQSQENLTSARSILFQVLPCREFYVFFPLVAAHTLLQASTAVWLLELIRVHHLLPAECSAVCRSDVPPGGTHSESHLSFLGRDMRHDWWGGLQRGSMGNLFWGNSLSLSRPPLLFLLWIDEQSERVKAKVKCSWAYLATCVALLYLPSSELIEPLTSDESAPPVWPQRVKWGGGGGAVVLHEASGESKPQLHLQPAASPLLTSVCVDTWGLPHRAHSAVLIQPLLLACK